MTKPPADIRSATPKAQQPTGNSGGDYVYSSNESIYSVQRYNHAAAVDKIDWVADVVVGKDM